MRAHISTWKGAARLAVALILLAVIIHGERPVRSGDGAQICFLIDGQLYCTS